MPTQGSVRMHESLYWQRGDVRGRTKEIQMAKTGTVNTEFQEQLEKKVDWEQLEKRYSIVVEGNKATATRRGRLFGKLLTATATLGTKAVEVALWTGTQVEQFDVDHTKKFTESNLTDELKTLCMILIAEWEMAQAQVAAETASK